MTVRSISRYIVVLLILALLFGTNVTSIFFQSNKEIVYEYEITYSMCMESSSLCAYGAELQLANTGKVSLSNIAVEIQNIPREVKIDTRVLNLSASNPRKNDPSIQVNIMASEHEILIDDLSPGALVEAKFTGSVEPDKLEVLKGVGVNVVSDGEIIEGDPHGTALGRMLSPLLGFL